MELANFLRGARQGHSSSDLRAKIFSAGEEELFDFDVFQRLLASEQVRDQSDLGEVLDCLHFHVRVFEGIPVGDDAVVRHQDGVVARNVRFQSLRQF